jgi:DNA polymerase-3 subunit alpha
MLVTIADPALLAAIKGEIDPRRGGNGVVRLALRMAGGGEAVVVAGRDFLLDAELAERLARIVGEDAVDLSAVQPKLALVG